MVVVASLQLVVAFIKLDSITNQAELLGGFNQLVQAAFKHFKEEPIELVAIVVHLAEAQQLMQPFNQRLLFLELLFPKTIIALFLQPPSYLKQP